MRVNFIFQKNEHNYNHSQLFTAIIGTNNQYWMDNIRYGVGGYTRDVVYNWVGSNSHNGFLLELDYD